ncbi:hypothetical protein [Tolypothrix sp. VBCCA 56010]|uniref:hypothetical protein n=1 Tax=Tolypothrix sp. VBCCA 56010 TaxID=3137731 RepID=UPI003D7DB921
MRIGGQEDKGTRRQGKPARCGGLLRCSDWRGQGGISPLSPPSPLSSLSPPSPSSSPTSPLPHSLLPLFASS